MSQKINNDAPPPTWSVTHARRRFAELLRHAAREPQAVYQRNRLVAAVVGPDDYPRLRAWLEERGGSSLAEEMAELREICAAEGYELDVPARGDRATPWDDTGEVS